MRAESPRSASEAPCQGGKPMPRLLIVDNNLIDIEVIKEALTEAGLDAFVEVVMDVPEAIARIDSRDLPPPHLVLLDLRLTFGHGLDVLRHIRAIDDLRGLPVIVLSSVIDEPERAACLASGATAVVMKPQRFADHVELSRQWRTFLGD